MNFREIPKHIPNRMQFGFFNPSGEKNQNFVGQGRGENTEVYRLKSPEETTLDSMTPSIDDFSRSLPTTMSTTLEVGTLFHPESNDSNILSNVSFSATSASPLKKEDTADKVTAQKDSPSSSVEKPSTPSFKIQYGNIASTNGEVHRVNNNPGSSLGHSFTNENTILSEQEGQATEYFLADTKA